MVHEIELATPVVESLYPLPAKVFHAPKYPSFSKVVNSIILDCPTEIVICCSYKARPTKDDVNRMLKLIDDNYGFVGLYRFGFFGFKKELIRKVGFFDEKFIGGEYEDCDFVRRMIEKDIAYWEDESIRFIQRPTTWDTSKTRAYFLSKWREIDNTFINSNCNFLVAEYPIQRNDYQNGINAKPAFIRKALEACQGRGVLYIDGDMYLTKYPAIFDLKDIDYMARGWNIDPRSSIKHLTDVCFDPYIFETSGGTMFFGNTPLSRTLLDKWEAEMNASYNIGKAEDRVISMIVTKSGFILRANVIQLPIEYLWLNDIFEYKGHPTSVYKSGAIIEHPACLTGEERATDMGASTDRQPPGYDEYVADIVECKRNGGVFYEYIFFPANELVETMGPYLDYMEGARNFITNNPLFKVVRYHENYGSYNPIAYANDEKARAFQIEPKKRWAKELPLNAPIYEILAYLYSKRDVQVGEYVDKKEPESQFVAVPLETTSNHYYPALQLDTSKSMYISSNSVIVQHLLRMCETLEFINTHLLESYMFTSRIRWELVGIQTGGKQISQLKTRK